MLPTTNAPFNLMSPIACRRAVRRILPIPADHIWVTDELLADAYHRFLHASRFSQRRHGSNVPGPLEARKRSSKRRIMALAPSAGGGAAPNAAMLFGPAPNGPPAWRYQPPSSLPQTASSDPQPPTLPKWLLNLTPPAPLQPQEPALESIDTRVSNVLEPAPATVEQSFDDRILCFRSLVTSKTEYTVLRDLFIEYCPWEGESTRFSGAAFKHMVDVEIPFDQLLKFLLDPSVHIPQAGNFARLLRMVNACPLNLTQRSITTLQKRYQDVFAAIAKVNQPDSQLNLTDSEVMRVVYTLKAANPLILDDRKRSDLYLTLWQSSLDRGSVVSQKSFQAEMFEQITRTFRCHYQSSKLRWMTIKPDPLVGQLVGLSDWYANLKKAPRRSHDILTALNTIPRSLLPSAFKETTECFSLLPDSHQRALQLESWLTRVDAFTRAFLPEEERQKIMDLVHGQTVQQVAPVDLLSYLDTIDLKIMLPLIITSWTPESSALSKSHRAKLLYYANNYFEQESPSPNRSLGGALLHVLVKMEELKAPTSMAADKAIELVYRQPGGGAKAVFQFLSELSLQTELNFSPQTLYLIVLETMYTDCAHAHKLCELVARLDKRYSADFPVGYILDGLRSMMDMSHIVLSARRRNHLPTPYHRVPLVNLYQIRTELIHQIAYQYALDESFTHKSASRAIYYLWKYLRVYRLPIGPLFTKAMVKVFVTRPMEDRRWVCTRRFVFVRNAVEAIEGKETAAKLHEVFWHWRGEIIRGAMKRHLAAGGVGRANVTTVRKLGI